MANFGTGAWIAFGLTFGVLFAVDLFAHRHAHQLSRRAAIIWTVLWIVAGVGFSLFVLVAGNSNQAGEYLAAYAIEKTLSLDNLFVFLLVFNSLKLSKAQQRKALSWGIFGALVFRAALIFAGTSAIEQWKWLEYLFGGILFAAAWHAFREDPATKKESRVVQWLSQHLPVSAENKELSFTVKEGNSRKVTRLLVAILAIELTDIVFAIDSVPAALSITRDRFLIYSSNAFAILGLRSLYLVMAETIAHLRYLHYGLAAILTFAGLKIVLGDALTIPPLVSVGIIAACIAVAVWFSVRSGRSQGKQRRAA